MEQNKIVRHPVSFPVNKSDYNNNNLHEYDPYILRNDKIVIDKTWWNSLTDYIRNRISCKIDFELDDLIIPHPIQKDNKCKMLKIMYQSYFDGFDYNIWYRHDIPNGPKNVRMVLISNNIKMILKTMFMTGTNNKSEELLEFKNQIDKIMVGNVPYFVRLSSTSGKNENSLKPLYNSDQVIKHITSNKLFVFQEYDILDKDSYVIMMPWNTIIDERYEFRIFVVNGKLTAISIQKWFDIIQHTQEELKIFKHALSNIKFLDSFETKTFVADIYVDMETKECHLIEVNPFGAHCGAGSSLFNWIEDYDILHGNNGDNHKIQLRYLSCIKY